MKPCASLRRVMASRQCGEPAPSVVAQKQWSPPHERVRLGRMATEAEAVTEVIPGVALCSICIVRKAQVSPLTVLAALARIGQQMKVIEGMTRV
jgi:hypothetical protein